MSGKQDREFKQADVSDPNIGRNFLKISNSTETLYDKPWDIIDTMYIERNMWDKESGNHFIKNIQQDISTKNKNSLL